MKKIKYLLKVLGCFLIVLLCKEDVYAKEIYESQTEIEEKYVELYNFDNEVVAYYIELNSGGYVIVSADGEEFIEYSLDENKYCLENGCIYYYTGPLGMYFRTSDFQMMNCRNLQTVDFSELKCTIQCKGKENAEKALMMAKNVTMSVESVTVLESNKLSYTTSTYSYNPDGRCGSVAAAILFRYYYDHVSSLYIADEYLSNDGVSLINLLTTRYINVWANYIQLTNGMNSYLHSRGLGASNVAYLYGLNSSSVYAKIKNYINTGKPLIVGLTNHPTYQEHWVVGTGYRTTQSAGQTFYTVWVNDGYGNRDVVINLSYIDGCVYIK